MLQPDPEGVAVHKDKLEALLLIAGCAGDQAASAPKVRGVSFTMANLSLIDFILIFMLGVLDF